MLLGRSCVYSVIYDGQLSVSLTTNDTLLQQVRDEPDLQSATFLSTRSEPQASALYPKPLQSCYLPVHHQQQQHRPRSSSW